MKPIKSFLYTFFSNIKMVNKYYQTNKEKLLKEARERYQNLWRKRKRKKASVSP